MKITVYTRVGYKGWECYSMLICEEQQGELANLMQFSAENWFLEYTCDGQKKEEYVVKNAEIFNVLVDAKGLVLQMKPFSYYSRQFKLSVGEKSWSEADVETVSIVGAEQFEAMEKYGVNYRLYTPKAHGPRPLFLYLHGGGRKGTDNWQQMTEYGPIKLMEEFPEMFIMAPQCRANCDPNKLHQFGSFEETVVYKDCEWSRSYLSDIADIIREMIAEGKVNEHKIYVMGMSLGGAGAIRMMSVAGNLFTAAIPCAPTMCLESYNTLCGLTDARIWIASSYIDQNLFRHKYIVDGITALRDGGNQNAHYTLFSPEELEKYGIGNTEGMTTEQRLRENHEVHVLALNDEHGILSWAVSQTK